LLLSTHMRTVYATAALVASFAAQGATTSYTCEFTLEATPKGLSKQSKPFELRFVVDTGTKKAYLMGNAGSSEVEIIPNTDGISFVEITRSGNVMVTAITKSGQAVHSRNGIMFNELVPSQYYGKCAVR
jgi:hypothetical protein